MTLAAENVWDFPRPPRLERVADPISVIFAGVEVARTTRGWRVLETSHAPAYYVPPQDVLPGVLQAAPGRTTVCEWKGRAVYWTLKAGGQRAEGAAWSYPEPTGAFGPLRDCVAFYAGRMQRCQVGDAVVLPQDGDFYGGWVTPNLIGPIKGARGTEGW